MSEFPPNKLEILRKEDAYPYEWVDSYEKFKYTEFVFIHQYKMVKRQW